MIIRLKKGLKRQLSLQLPGIEAQNRMTPIKRRSPDLYIKNYPQKGAVLVLLYPQNDVIQTVTILHSDYDGAHSGQVSFPGGKYEEGDENFEKTALREAKEELGIDIDRIEILGAMTELYIPISNFIVYPFLGIMDKAPNFNPDPVEVQKVIEIGLHKLLDEAYVKRKPIMISLIGKEIEAPYFDLQGQTIWGATAMILSELRELLKRTGITFS